MSKYFKILIASSIVHLQNSPIAPLNEKLTKECIRVSFLLKDRTNLTFKNFYKCKRIFPIKIITMPPVDN